MAEEPEYDAFLSYSHALDQRLAPAVQNELQSFAKPWYRRRSLRIFRDRTNLAADPGLWASIEQALRASRWFILLASPEAARSQWVAREVEFWLREKSADTLLIVLAGGELVWGGDDIAVSGLLQVFGDRLPEGFLEVPGNSQLNRLSFSGDGRYLAGSTGDSVVLWDLDQTDRLAERIATDEPDDYSFIGKPDLAVDPGGENAFVLPKLGAEHLRRVGLRDGEHVALIDRNVLVVIDLRAARAVLVSPGGGDDVEFTSAGELLVQRSYGQVEVWNVPQGRQVRTLEASDLLEDSMAVSADGRYAAGVRGDGLLVLLDLASGGRIGQFSLPQPASGITGAVGRSTAIAFTPDSRELLSLTSGGELLRWPLDPRAWAQRACAAAGRDLTSQEWRLVVGTEPAADLRCMR
ncbi:TIR domain-containing protein [Saccharopolyspora shandongensis]|uniref:TIR domain-containing protein n=1 Tax=Saccharopolyspora shandongensis TaxID=418495 RepID=UPI0033F6D9FD